MRTECLMPKTFVYYGTKMLAYLIVDSILKQCQYVLAENRAKMNFFQIVSNRQQIF